MSSELSRLKGEGKVGASIEELQKQLKEKENSIRLLQELVSGF